jgi:hypothetical protein
MAISTTYINNREVPETFHDSIRSIIKAVKKQKITPDVDECMTTDSIFSSKKDDYVACYSLLGYFLNKRERTRIDNHNDCHKLSADAIRKMLGITKLELKTIYGMKRTHLDFINDEYMRLHDAYYGYNADPAAMYDDKLFKKNFIKFLEKQLVKVSNYDNPGSCSCY